MAEVFDNVACTVCGCLCDDLRLTVEGRRIVGAERACALAEPYFLGQNAERLPAATIEGQPVALEKAVERAAALLREARSPLLIASSRGTTDDQRAALALVERVGGTIDTWASLASGPAVLAMQAVGQSTCTLGEVKQRADLVVFWRADPVVTHPRFIERFVPAGRVVVVVDEKETATAATAQHFLPLEPGGDGAALTTLRALVRAIDPTPVTATGAPLDALADLARRLKSCRFGVVFFGSALGQGAAGHRRVEALFQLTTELNAFTRCYARALGGLTGAGQVFAWQTGYPFGVNLSRPYLRYNPGEFTALEMLERGEVDACLLIDSEAAGTLSIAARGALERLPTIALDPPTSPSTLPATVRFTTAVAGLHHGGTAYRLDDVALPLRAVLPAAYPSAAKVLEQMTTRLG